MKTLLDDTQWPDEVQADGSLASPVVRAAGSEPPVVRALAATGDSVIPSVRDYTIAFATQIVRHHDGRPNTYPSQIERHVDGVGDPLKFPMTKAGATTTRNFAACFRGDGDWFYAREFFNEFAGRDWVGYAFLVDGAIWLRYFSEEPADIYSLSRRALLALFSIGHPTCEHLWPGERGLKRGEVGIYPYYGSPDTEIPLPLFGGGALLDLTASKPQMSAITGPLEIAFSPAVEIAARPESWEPPCPFRALVELRRRQEERAGQSPDAVPPGLTAAEWDLATPEEKAAWTR